MAETRKIVFEFEATAENPATKFKSLKEEIRALQREMMTLSAEGDVTSERFQKLNARAGELRDRMADVGAQVSALASDTPKLDLFAEGIRGISAGFQVAQGATALFGSENEELQKTMVKLQATMVLANGATEIANMLQSNSKIQTLARAQAQLFLNSTLVTGTAAATGFSRALVASGIGAIAVALTAAAVALGRWIFRSSEAVAIMEEQEKAQEKYNKQLEIYDLKSEAVIAQLEAQGASEEKLFEAQKRIAEGRIALMRMELTSLTAKHEASQKILNSDIESYIKAQTFLAKYLGFTSDLTGHAGRLKESVKVEQDLNLEVQKLTAELNKQEAALTNLTTTYKKNQKAKSDQRQKEIEEANKLRREADQKAIEDAMAETKPAMQPITDVFKAVNGMTLEEYNKQQQAKVDLDRWWVDYSRTEREAQDASEIESLTSMMRENGAKEVEVVAETERLKARQKEKWRKIDKDARDKASKEELAQQKENRLRALMDFSDSLKAIGEIVMNTAKASREEQKRAFEFNKKISIAATLIDTYVAAQQAYRSAGNPILGALAATAALLSGLARVSAIKKQTFQAPNEERPSETNVPTAGMTPTARPPDERSTGADQFGGFPGSPGGMQGMSQPQTIRAYVVDRDIRDANERENEIRRFAQLN